MRALILRIVSQRGRRRDVSEVKGLNHLADFLPPVYSIEAFGPSTSDGTLKGNPAQIHYLSTRQAELRLTRWLSEYDETTPGVSMERKYKQRVTRTAIPRIKRENERIAPTGRASRARSRICSGRAPADGGDGDARALLDMRRSSGAWV